MLLAVLELLLDDSETCDASLAAASSASSLRQRVQYAWEHLRSPMFESLCQWTRSNSLEGKENVPFFNFLLRGLLCSSLSPMLSTFWAGLRPRIESDLNNDMIVDVVCDVMLLGLVVLC